MVQYKMTHLVAHDHLDFFRSTPAQGIVEHYYPRGSQHAVDICTNAICPATCIHHIHFARANAVSVRHIQDFCTDV